MAEAPPEAQETSKPNGEPAAETEVEKTVEGPKTNGSSTTANGDATQQKRPRTHSDPDAQQMVIASLRSQVQDLFSQVNELNNKLVKSYDRVSDLEDDLHMASATNRSSSLKISQLELERTQHLSALNTGLLVEKSHVTAELTRLMEKATEEAAQRGQAESARRDIEKDLDDLSATLFGQANTMVAEARFAQHLSEQKVDVAERALKSAEEAVGVMQQQMQGLQAEKEEAEKKAEESVAAMGMTIGKGLGRGSGGNLVRSIRLLSSHAPYQEFLLFVAHLRSVHPSSPQPPAMTTLLPLPFLARLLTEDSEPTIRLDLAPSLNWLSRRSVLAAIHNGQLIIEPMSSTTLLQEPSLSGPSSSISCALCGSSIFSTSGAPTNPLHPVPPILGHSNSGSSSWSASLFKKPSISTITSAQPIPPSRQTSFQQPSSSQVYIFRLATPASATSSISLPSLPRTSISGSSSAPPLQTHTDNHTAYTSSPNPQSSTIYPLCTNNWCLSRLRMTCSLWAFVRSGIIEKIWEEEVPALPTTAASPATEKPPIPPRRRGIWGMATALGERATSWGEGDKDKSKRANASTPPPVEPKHPERRRLPPPLPPSSADASAAPPTPEKHAVPPPLPRRSEVRHTSPPKEPSTTAEATAATPSKDPKLPPRPPRRPITPSSVPLPESRPHTPPVASGGLAAASSTPGGAVPPPLPRRAAARGSRLLLDSGSPSTSPAEPILETKAEEADQPAKAEPKSEQGAPAAEEKETEANASAVLSPSIEEEEFVDAQSEPVVVVADKEDPVKEAGVVGDADIKAGSSEASEAVKETMEVEGKAEKEKNVVGETEEKENDSVEEREEEKNLVEEKEQEKVQENEKEEKEEEKAKEKEKEEMAEKVEVKLETGEHAEETAKEAPEAQLDKVKDEKVLAKVTETQTTDQNEVQEEAQSTESADSSKSLYDDDATGTHVGEATWEERTWKEIVRLKEEMFWARIGGTRQ
ncbi:hypothetical protein H0H87_005231 [Tephrocybe sp. NHM501043]|nr:hypothetical protein H0H87_005231 [Tephrocybe sp. NHM501043]